MHVSYVFDAFHWKHRFFLPDTWIPQRFLLFCFPPPETYMFRMFSDAFHLRHVFSLRAFEFFHWKPSLSLSVWAFHRKPRFSLCL